MEKKNLLIWIDFSPAGLTFFLIVLFLQEANLYDGILT